MLTNQVLSCLNELATQPVPIQTLTVVFVVKLLLVLGSITVLFLRGEAAGVVCGQRAPFPTIQTLPGKLVKNGVSGVHGPKGEQGLDGRSGIAGTQWPQGPVGLRPGANWSTWAIWQKWIRWMSWAMFSGNEHSFLLNHLHGTITFHSVYTVLFASARHKLLHCSPQGLHVQHYCSFSIYTLWT